MRALLWLGLLAPSLAGGDASVAVPAHAEFVTHAHYSNAERGLPTIEGRGVRWRTGARVQWTHTFTAAWRRATLMNRVSADEQDEMRRLYHPQLLGDALVLGDERGVLVLARADGAVRLEWAAPAERMGWPFDNAEITIVSGGVACHYQARHGWFLADCNRRLFHFDGHRLAVFDSTPWKLAETRDVSVDIKPGRIKDVRAHSVVAGASVDMHGVILD